MFSLRTIVDEEVDVEEGREDEMGDAEEICIADGLESEEAEKATSLEDDHAGDSLRSEVAIADEHRTDEDVAIAGLLALSGISLEE